MHIKYSGLPRGTKVTFWFLLVLMGYFGIDSLTSLNQNFSYILSHSLEGTWFYLLATVLQICISFGAVYTIWKFSLWGLRWLWAEVILSGLFIVIPFISKDFGALSAGTIVVLLNTIFGLLMVGGYKEILKRTSPKVVTQDQPTTMPPSK